MVGKVVIRVGEPSEPGVGRFLFPGALAVARRIASRTRRPGRRRSTSPWRESVPIGDALPLGYFHNSPAVPESSPAYD
jgi:hypothetical protein